MKKEVMLLLMLLILNKCPQLASINKKLSGIDSGVQNMGRQSKEILNNVDQKKGTLGNLLTMTGSITLKSICFLNLNLEANSAAENNLLKEFIDDAKEVG